MSRARLNEIIEAAREQRLNREAEAAVEARRQMHQRLADERIAAAAEQRRAEREKAAKALVGAVFVADGGVAHSSISKGAKGDFIVRVSAENLEVVQGRRGGAVVFVRENPIGAAAIRIVSVASDFRSFRGEVCKTEAANA